MNIILLRGKINICSGNKILKNIFLVARFFARICARAIFSGVIRIRTHNLNLARTLAYYWATPSHVTNNEIFSFYHHFLISYTICFTAITISNKKLFNYKVVDLVASYNFLIYIFSIWDHLKIWNSKFKPYIWVPKQPQLKKFWTTKL